MSRKDDMRKLMAEHQRRLQRLKEQKARYGINTSPEVLNEIEDIETEIERLQTELAGVKDTDEPETFTHPTLSIGVHRESQKAPSVGVQKQKIVEAIGQLKGLTRTLKHLQAELNKGLAGDAQLMRRLDRVSQEQTEILTTLLNMAQATGEENIAQLLTEAIAADDEPTWPELISELLAWHGRL